ncbi:kelch-like protein 14 [Pteropus vampyrus]|uniref:Kelch-like protein 14 n=1 Tax=Pteropus vampyrus TaxID=132908 RepID=A0A6P6CLL2_PTEVA|nr:kelch-like protein 14 [Pteropus vampyrus]
MSRSGDRTSTFDPSHSDNLLHGLNLLWRKQLFCDVTLTAQGQQFHCHKAVLASCSQYFRSLFSSHPPLGGGVGGQDGLGAPKDQQQQPQQQPPQPQQPPPQEEPGTPSSSPDDKLLTSPRAINNLVLQGCSSIGLRLVLEYLYTANVTLSLDTVEEVLSVSKILHIPQVTKLCVQFLNDQISVQNYKQVCKIAALHGLEETKKLANKYLVEDVLLLNFEEMRALLDSLPPPVESELALFQMSVLWLEHDRETRMQYAPDLMKRLRFALIPAPELVERVQSVDFMRTDPVCQKLLLDAMNYHLMPFRQHCRQSLASRIRSNKKMLLLVGGLPPGPDRLPSNLVQYYDDEKKTWKILTNLLLIATSSSRICAQKGKISSCQLQCGNPFEKAWLSHGTISGLITHCVQHSDDGPRFPAQGMECSNDNWKEKQNGRIMPYNSAHHCVVEVENFLFVLGGEDQWNPNGGVHNGEYVPWLYCYDPVMDVWARKQDMNTKRAIHTLAVMNDRLYAIGGNHLKGFSHLDVMLVECYDPKGDQWNILQTPILEGRSGPGCAVLDDSIYLVGGYSWSMDYDVIFQDHVRELQSKESPWSYEIRRWFTEEMSFEQDPLKQNLGHTSEEMLKWSLA